MLVTFNSSTKRFENLSFPGFDFRTWILSSSFLLACSSFFWRLSSSRVCCCSFCSHLMYSTEAFRIVPLFQRISLPKNRKDNPFLTCLTSAEAQEKYPHKAPPFIALRNGDLHCQFFILDITLPVNGKFNRIVKCVGRKSMPWLFCSKINPWVKIGEAKGDKGNFGSYSKVLPLLILLLLKGRKCCKIGF